jgi:TatD DNase family protein
MSPRREGRGAERPSRRLDLGAASSGGAPVLVDSHAHLALLLEELGEEALDEVLARYGRAWDEASARGLAGPFVVDPGIDAEDLAQRRELLGALPFVRLAAGIWPSKEALADPAGSLSALRGALAEAGGPAAIAAVGEGGLDYHHMNGSRAAQRELFEGLLDIAGELGRSMIVHSREAAADTLAVLGAARPSRPPVMHCFGYGVEEARAFLESGCFISFAGNLTYKSAVRLREACAFVPPDRLLLETDAPYMNPEPRRGRPSSPLDIGRTYEAAAAIRGVGLRELARTVAANARRLFGP